MSGSVVGFCTLFLGIFGVCSVHSIWHCPWILYMFLWCLMCLQCPWCLSDPTRPTMYDSPANVTSTATSFVVYDPNDEGHYAAALPFNNHTSVSSPPPTTVSCRCGSNKEATKVTPTSYIQSPFYAPRCKCLKNEKPCNSACRRSQCRNPYGQRPILSNERTRVKAKEQAVC